MTILAQKKYWSDSELLSLADDGFEREVVNGELVVSPGGVEHGMIIMRMSSQLGSFVYGRDIGELFDGQTGCRMKSGDVFSPDISFVSKVRMEQVQLRGQTFFPGGPDLVIEVLSPSETVGAAEKKVAQYFDNGTRLAWIVHPANRSVHVYRGPASDKILYVADSIDGEAILPGFKLPLARIFP